MKMIKSFSRGILVIHCCKSCFYTLEKAKEKILNTLEYLNATESFTIQVEYMTGLMPLTFTKTNNGWVFDERYD